MDAIALLWIIVPLFMFFDFMPAMVISTLLTGYVLLSNGDIQIVNNEVVKTTAPAPTEQAKPKQEPSTTEW